MSWNMENSTRLGSIRMYFSSSGVAWKSMPAISAVILRTGTPWPGCSSYCVTDGPELTPITVASTSKLASVPSISLIFALISSCNRSLRTVTVSSRVRSGFIQTRWISSSTRVDLVSSPAGTTVSTGSATAAFFRRDVGTISSSIGPCSAAIADSSSGDGCGGGASGRLDQATEEDRAEDQDAARGSREAAKRLPLGLPHRSAGAAGGQVKQTK